MQNKPKKLDLTKKLTTTPVSFRSSKALNVQLDTMALIVKDMLKIDPSQSVLIRRAISHYFLYLIDKLSPDTDYNGMNDLQAFIKAETHGFYNAAGREMN